MDKDINDTINQHLKDFHESADEIKSNLIAIKGEDYFQRVGMLADLIAATNELNMVMCEGTPAIVRFHVQHAVASAINNINARMANSNDQKQVKEFSQWVIRLVEARRQVEGKISLAFEEHLKNGGEDSHD